MGTKDFSPSNYNHKAHEPFLEGILKNNGFCGRLGKTLTLLLEDQSELNGGLGGKAQAGRTREILWVSHNPHFLISGV